MKKLFQETAISSLALVTLLTLNPKAEAIPLGSIEPYIDGQLKNNELVIDTGFNGENPGIYTKIKPSTTSEAILGIRQDGNKILQASQGIKLSDSVLIAPYLHYESNKQANQFVGIYGQLDVLRSGNTSCNLNGFGEIGVNNYKGWRAGFSCNVSNKQ